jgi:hypothetical protein
MDDRGLLVRPKHKAQSAAHESHEATWDILAMPA